MGKSQFLMGKSPFLMGKSAINGYHQPFYIKHPFLSGFPQVVAGFVVPATEKPQALSEAELGNLGIGGVTKPETCRKTGRKW